MRVCVCSMFSPAYQELANLTIPNMEKYAARHGYDTHIIHVEDEKWMYKKHEAFKELFEKGYDLIWYKDVDAIITNLMTPIESFLHDLFFMFITTDVNEINGGSLIIKNTIEGRWLNDTILMNRSDFENEQNCINWLYKSQCFNQYVQILNHPSINSYRYSEYVECKVCVGRQDMGDWSEGNFVLHVPALSIPKRLEILSQAKITE